MEEVGTTYLTDESRIKGSADRVVSIKEKVQLLHLCGGENCVTIQGGRTGLCGAAVPTGGLVADMQKWNGISELIQEEGKTYVEVLPGTTLSDLQQFLKRKHLFFPVEPTESLSTLGGMFATNAAGPNALLYGRMSQYVAEVEWILPSGECLNVRRGEYRFDEQGNLCLSNGMVFHTDYIKPEQRKLYQLTPMPGMDLLDLLAGSEGMLGFFGKLKLQVIEQPKAIWKILMFFEKEETAVKFAEQLYGEAGTWETVDLAVLDYMNRESLRCLKKYASDNSKYKTIPEFPEQACAVLAELSASSDDDIEEALGSILELAEQCEVPDENIWAAEAADERARLQDFRHGVAECINTEVEEIRKTNAGFVKNALDAEFCDVKWSDFLSRIRTEIAVPHAIVLHIGRNLMHLDLLPESQTTEEVAQAKQCLLELCNKTHAIFCAESGIGKGKAKELLTYLDPDQIRVMRCFREQIPGSCFFNPGNAIFYPDEP